MIYTYNIGFAAGSGNREDLLDVVVNIDPWDTPLFTASPKTTANHTTHEWLTDTLAATASGSGAGSVEGAAFASSSATSARTRQSNWTMIFRKNIDVSQTQRAVMPAGVSDEYAYQIGKGLKELARNVEVVAFEAAGATATGATGTVRVMKSLQDFITTASNAFHCDSTAIGGLGGSTATACLLAAGPFNGFLEQIYEDGGDPDAIYVGARAKRRISSAFTGVSGLAQNLAANDKSIQNSVDFYDSDFGRKRIILDRWVPQGGTGTNVAGQVFAIETGMVRFAFLRPFKHVPLPPDGDSARGMVLGELTLEVGNANALGRLIGVSTALA